MLRAVSPLLFVMFACSESSSIVVTVSARSAVRPLDELDVRVVDGDDHDRTQWPLLGRTLPLTFTIGTEGRTGEVTITVTAHETDLVEGEALVLASAVTRAMPEPGARVDIGMLLEPADVVVNSTTGGEQALAFSAAFAGRQIAVSQPEGEEATLMMVWVDNSMARGRLFAADTSPMTNAISGDAEEFAIDPVPVGTTPVVRVVGNGDDYLVAWVDEVTTERAAVWTQQLSGRDAGRSGAARRVDVGPEAWVYEMSLFANTTGAVLAWVSGDELAATIHAQRFDSDGGLVGDSILVTAAPVVDLVRVRGVAVGDGFAVVWDTYDPDTYTPQAFMAVVDGDGVVVGPSRLTVGASADEDGAPVLVGLDDGEFAAVWRNNNVSGSIDRIVMQRFAANGAALSTPATLVDTHGSDEPAAAWQDGVLTVTWTGADDIWLGRFEEDGTPIGAAMVANTTTAGSQYESTVVTYLEGAVITAWSDNSQAQPDTDELAVRARVIYPN